MGVSVSVSALPRFLLVLPLRGGAFEYGQTSFGGTANDARLICEVTTDHVDCEEHPVADDGCSC